jgi:hypothetical protein
MRVSAALLAPIKARASTLLTSSSRLRLWLGSTTLSSRRSLSGDTLQRLLPSLDDLGLRTGDDGK